MVVVVLTCALPSVLLVGLVGGAAGRTATGDDAATAAARRLNGRMTGQLDRQAAALLALAGRPVPAILLVVLWAADQALLRLAGEPI